MRHYTIQLDRETCIGTHACNAEAPEYFITAEDGKIDLFDAVYNEQKDCWEAVAHSDYIEEIMSAADACPVDAISVMKITAEVE